MAVKKRGLGRGLSDIIEDSTVLQSFTPVEKPKEKKPAESKTAKPAAKKSAAPKTAPSESVVYVSLNDIKPNASQPRKTFNEDALSDLADSIKEHGVIQPILLRPAKKGYELVAGERRWRAARMSGLRTVPCIVRNFDDRQNAIVAIIENMQREDLDPIEEALGLKSMTEKYGFTQEQVSASLGRSRTYITNSIRLLKLPPEIQQYVSSGQMSAAHGRTIINIPDKAKQREIADKIIRNDLSVRATERLAEKVKDELRPERKKRKKKVTEEDTARAAEIAAVERELMTLTGTKVHIAGDENNGKIELEYYSLEELNRLIDALRDAFK
jgi:ParB family chromosome partitioning protein